MRFTLRRTVLLIPTWLAASALPAGAQTIDTQSNAIGRLTSVGNGQMRRYFEYDALGRAKRTEHVLEGVSYVFATEFAYPQNPETTEGPGTVARSMTFPDGERVEYTYDASGAQQGITTTPWPLPAVTETVVSRITRNARGQTIEVVYGNGAATTHSYNDETDLRLNRIFTSRPGTPDIQDYRYSFDPPGNVTAVQDVLVPWLSGEYTYDTLDQIESMNGSLRYRYDVTGNLVEIEGVTQSYGGAGQRGPHALAASGGTTYDYDLNGNVTSISDGTVLTWNVENMATKAARGGVTRNEKFFVGESLWQKVEGGVATLYLPSLRIENGQPRKYFGTFAERAVEDGGLKFYHSDHLGSSTVVTDMEGDVVHRIGYKPYGEDRGPAGGSFFPKYQFNFKEKESTGYYDYGARLYNSMTGRWLSADSLTADGQNRYAYVRNNPLGYRDPTGHAGEGPVDEGLNDPFFAPKLWLSWLKGGANALASAANFLVNTNPFLHNPDEIRLSDEGPIPKFTPKNVSEATAMLMGEAQVPALVGSVTSLRKPPTVMAFRAQGRPLLSIDDAGNVIIAQLRGRRRQGVAIHVGFDRKRASIWVTEKGRTQVVQFKVRKEFLKRLRATAQPEHGVVRDRTLPWRVDTAFPDQYAIPPAMFDEFQKAIVSGSGRVISVQRP